MPAFPARSGLLVHTGSYTPNTGGKGIGLAALRLDPVTGALTDGTGLPELSVSGPSFLAAHPSGHVLYSTNEAEAGTVSAFARRPDGALEPLGPRSPAAAPTPATWPSTRTAPGF